MDDNAKLSMPRLWDEDTEDWWESLSTEEQQESGTDLGKAKEKAVLHSLDIVRKNRDKPRRLVFDVKCNAVFKPAIDAMVARLDHEYFAPFMRHMDALAEDPTGAKTGGYSHETTLHVCAHVVENWNELVGGYTQVLQLIVDQFTPIYRLMSSTPTLFTVPAYDLLPDARRAVDTVYRLFTEWPLYHFFVSKRRSTPQICVFTENLRCALLRNHEAFCSERKVNPQTTRPLHIDALPRALVEAYFKGTPLLDFFALKVPLAWPKEVRQRHTHVIGDSGSGKTTLLKDLIEHDFLHNLDKPSLIVIDPHNDVVDWATKVATDRNVIFIDGGDVLRPPSVNPLAINETRLAHATPQQRERIKSDVLDTLSYIVGVLGMEMTGQMQSFFNHLGRLMLAYPALTGRPGTLDDLREALVTPLSDEVRSLVERLPDGRARIFLKRELFIEKGSRDSYVQTKTALFNRLDAIVSRPSSERLFSSPHNSIDWYHELNSGSVILVNTADSVLGEQGSILFGRMIIGQIMQALKLRDPAIPEPFRYPTYLYVDEAQNYFSEQTEKMLTDFRKLGCGVIFAHHSLGQTGLSDSLRSALLTNTNTKIAAKLKEDTSRMAALMGTTPEFIKSLPFYTFAVHIGSVTPQAVAFKTHIPNCPMKSGAQRAVFKWRNRERVSIATAPNERNAPPSLPSLPRPLSEEPSRDW